MSGVLSMLAALMVAAVVKVHTVIGGLVVTVPLVDLVGVGMGLLLLGLVLMVARVLRRDGCWLVRRQRLARTRVRGEQGRPARSRQAPRTRAQPRPRPQRTGAYPDGWPLEEAA